MTPSSSQARACPHECGCNYTSKRADHIRRHEQTRHWNCTPKCPSHDSPTRQNVKFETSDSVATKPRIRRRTIPNTKIRCIFDPMRRMESYEATKDDVSWLDAVDLLTTDVSSLLNCEGLRGYVFPAPGKDDAVRIYDWAYVAFFCFQHPEGGCSVEFQSWEDFSDLLLTQEPIEVANVLKDEEVDCIFGTINLSIRPLSENADQNSLPLALLGLAEVLPVFPSPSGCQRHGAKVDLVQTIDSIARRMGTARPKSVPWDPDLKSPPNGWVLKREFSDAGRHVYIPDHPLQNGERAMATETRRANRFVRKANDKDQMIGCRWLAQEYVPTLASLGEFRFMWVDGEPVRVVITRKCSRYEPEAGEFWSMEGIKTMASLQKIRSFIRCGKLIEERAVFSPNQTPQDAKKAQDELRQFVTNFFRHLKAEDGQNSSLQVFCRIDVGIFVEKPDTVSYFVNEVERGITTSLWVADGAHTAGLVGMGMVSPLKHWIAAEQDRVGVRT